MLCPIEATFHSVCHRSLKSSNNSLQSWTLYIYVLLWLQWHYWLMSCIWLCCTFSLLDCTEEMASIFVQPPASIIWVYYSFCDRSMYSCLFSKHKIQNQLWDYINTLCSHYALRLLLSQNPTHQCHSLTWFLSHDQSIHHMKAFSSQTFLGGCRACKAKLDLWSSYCT